MSKSSDLRDLKKTCYLCRDEADALEEVSSLPGQYRYMSLSSKKYQPADYEAMTFPEKFFASIIEREIIPNQS